MSRMRIVVPGVVVLLIVLAVSLYTRQTTVEAQAQPQTQALNIKPDANFACTCTSGGILQGMAILQCACGTTSCLAVRSTANPGDTSVSCSK